MHPRSRGHERTDDPGRMLREEPALLPRHARQLVLKQARGEDGAAFDAIREARDFAELTERLR